MISLPSTGFYTTKPVVSVNNLTSPTFDDAAIY